MRSNWSISSQKAEQRATVKENCTCAHCTKTKYKTRLDSSHLVEPRKQDKGVRRGKQRLTLVDSILFMKEWQGVPSRQRIMRRWSTSSRWNRKLVLRKNDNDRNMHMQGYSYPRVRLSGLFIFYSYEMLRPMKKIARKSLYHALPTSTSCFDLPS